MCAHTHTYAHQHALRSSSLHFLTVRQRPRHAGTFGCCRINRTSPGRPIALPASAHCTPPRSGESLGARESAKQALLRSRMHAASLLLRCGSDCTGLDGCLGKAKPTDNIGSALINAACVIVQARLSCEVGLERRITRRSCACKQPLLQARRCCVHVGVEGPVWSRQLPSQLRGNANVSRDL